jgi:uncharacterized protein (TIGR02147 family)
MNYRLFLKEELERRRQVNSLYSLRAFSRQLKMSPAQLSQIISGKRPLTAKTAFRIAEVLALSPLETSTFVESTLQSVPKETSTAVEIKEDEFSLIADWYHLAILSLSELRQHRADPRWIASQLGIKTSEASVALQRLQKLKIIEIKGGKVRQIMNPLKTPSDVPSSANRIYHAQNLDKAKEKLETVPVADREFSAITMAVSRKNLPKAKKMITEFKRKLCALLEQGEKQAVYSLAIQLFPVSKLEEK